MQHESAFSDHQETPVAALLPAENAQANLLSSLTIATGIAIGAWLLWAAAVNIVATTINTFIHQDYDLRSFRPSMDGEYIMDVRQSKNGVHSAYRADVEGHRLPDINEDDENLPVRTTTWARIPPQTNLTRPVDFSTIAYEEVQYSGRVNQIWYFVQARDSFKGAWLECWSVAERRRLYFLGTEGQSSTAPPPDQRFQIPDHRRNFSGGWAHFDGTGSLRYGQNSTPGPDILYLADADSIFEIRLIKPSVRKLAQTPENLISIGTATPYLVGPKSLSARQTDQRRLYFRTHHQLIEMDLSGAVIRTISLLSIPHRSAVTFSEVSNEDGTHSRHLWWESSIRTNSGFDVVVHIFIINDQNERSEPQTIAWQNQRSGLSLAEVNAAIGLGLPGSMLLIGAELSRRSILSVRYHTSPIAVIVCVLLTSLALWRFQQHAATHAVAHPNVWRLFILLLGWPGYLGYRCHRVWQPVSRTESTVNETLSLPLVISA